MEARGGESSSKIVLVTRGQRLLLFATICLLPYALVPLELTHHKISTNYPLFVVILFLGLTSRVLHLRLDQVERVVLLFGLYLVLRALIGAIPGSVSVALLEIGRESTKLFSAVVLYRVAQTPGVLPTLRRAVTASLVILVSLGFYQLHEGISRLQTHGYLAPDFNYYAYVQDGSSFRFVGLRPFGTFPGPTVYAAYIAMLLGFLLWANWGVKRRLIRWVILAYSFAGLLVTNTRAAWLALVASVLVVSLVQPPSQRSKALRVGIAVALLFALFLAVDHAAASHLGNRLATLSQSGFTSNEDRLALWSGTWHAVTSDLGVFLFGFGQDSFSAILSGYISPVVAALGHAHDVYLEILYGYGATGLALYLLVLTRLGRGLRSSFVHGSCQSVYVSAALGAFVAVTINGLFENLWTGYNFFVTLFLLLGVGSAVRRQAAMAF